MSRNDAGRVAFDRAAYPVVVVRMPEHGSVEAIHEWYDAVERLLDEAEEPIALVYDLRPLNLVAVAAAHRATVADRVSRLRAHRAVGKLGADARIVTNAIVAGAVTAVTWLTGTMPWPQATFASEHEAVSWARGELEKRRRLRPTSQDLSLR